MSFKGGRMPILKDIITESNRTQSAHNNSTWIGFESHRMKRTSFHSCICIHEYVFVMCTVVQPWIMNTHIGIHWWRHVTRSQPSTTMARFWAYWFCTCHWYWFTVFNDGACVLVFIRRICITMSLSFMDYWWERSVYCILNYQNKLWQTENIVWNGRRVSIKE